MPHRRAFQHKTFLASLAQKFIDGVPVDPNKFEIDSPARISVDYFYELIDEDAWERLFSSREILPSAATTYREAIEHARRLATAKQILAATETNHPGVKANPTNKLADDLLIALTRWAMRQGIAVECPGKTQPDGAHTEFSQLAQDCITEAEASFLAAASELGWGECETLPVKAALGDLHGSTLFRRLRSVKKQFGPEGAIKTSKQRK